MNNVLHWIKSNVFIVVFVVLMIAAAVGLPFVAKSMNAKVRAEVDDRAKKYSELDSLRRTSVTEPTAGAPGEQRSMLVNNSLLTNYEQRVNVLRDDADKVRNLAVEFNRKGRSPLMDNVLPTTPAHLRSVAPGQFHAALGRAYEQLLRDIGAGQPPDPADVEQTIQAEQGQFLASTISKPSIDQLTEDEMEQLREYLSTRRLTMYVEKAETYSMYADARVIHISPLPNADPPWSELFNWQWEYWVYEDVLRGLADANAGSESILDAPVKSVELLTWLSGMPGATGLAQPSGRTGFGGAGGGGGGSAAPSGGAAPDFTVGVQKDYATSFTGRVTNPLYDVVTVELKIVADAHRLPEIMDALSSRNFITVLDTTIVPRDAFADVANGFVYGDRPVAEVTLLLETVWLREWTEEFMPDETRTALNIPIPQPPADAAAATQG